MARSPASATIGAGGGGGGPQPSNVGPGSGMVPLDQAYAYIDLKVDKMKAELKTELHSEVSRLPKRWEFFGAIVTGLIAAFGIFSVMGDRIETAVDRSSSLTSAIEKIAVQGEQNSKALKDLQYEREAAERIGHRTGSNSQVRPTVDVRN